MELWNCEFPVQIVHENVESLERYLSGLRNVRHLLIEEKGEILGWLAVFEREQEPWFIIIVSREAQGEGLGKRLMQKAMQEHKKLNGWIVYQQEYLKQDNEQYPGPVAFYQKLGFRLLPDVTLEKGGVVSTKITWSKT